MAPTATTPRPMIDVHEVAGMIPCSTRTIQRWAKEGLIPAPANIGGLVRWPRTTIERWIEAGCPSQSQPVEG